MPSREDIEKFSRIIESLGPKAQADAPRGEDAEAGLEEGFPSGLDDMLGGLGEEGGGAPPEPGGEAPGAEGVAGPESGAALEAGLEAEAPSEPKAIEFDALFGEEGEAKPFPEIPPLESPEALESGKEEGDLSAGEADIMELIGGESGPAEEAPMPEEAPPLPSFEPGGTPAPPEEEPALEGIELPSFEEMTMPEEALTGPEQALEAPEAPTEVRETPFREEEAPFPPEFGEGLEIGGAVEPAAPEAAPGPSPEGAEGTEAAGFGAIPEVPPQMEEGFQEGELPDRHGLDEFTLPESVEEFGVPARPPVREGEKPPREAAPKPEAVEELGAAEADIRLTDQQFARLKRTLDSLPRNLKIAVQDIIAEGKATVPDLQTLIDLLVQGAAPQRIAAHTETILGQRIRLPAGFEKKSGIAFEEEQRSFAYVFRENFLPVFRTFFLTVAGIALFAFLGYRYVYRPMDAFFIYRTGYQDLVANRFTAANQDFDRATGIWPMKNWFYRYAEGYIDKREFDRASDKYLQLLRRWPGDVKGTIDFARMKSTWQSDYSGADSLLSTLLETNMYNYAALLAAGDNALEWGREDGSRYENARLYYATLIQKYGQKDELLYRMMRYFIRSDTNANNYAEIEKLRAYFDARRGKVDAPAYAELGGYLIDISDLAYAQDVLIRALDSDPRLVAAYYNLARYYRILEDQGQEEKSLNSAIALFKSSDLLTRDRILMEVDSHSRFGELLYSRDSVIDAEREYRKAIGLVEQYRKDKLIRTGPIYGKPYYDLGNLFYYRGGNLEEALAQYELAAGNGFTDPELDYRIGYIRYAEKDYKAALESFIASADAYMERNVPLNLLFALGNTFYQRSDFFAAQGYYLRIMDTLNDKRASIGDFKPQGVQEDRDLLGNMLEVNNNLGVVTFRLSEKMGDRNLRSEALVYLSFATEQYDVLSRSPNAERRAETRDLPTLNMRGILYPAARFDPQIYSLIPKDTQVQAF